MNDITIEHARKITAQQLASVFARSGINRPTHNLTLMQAMVDTADSLVTAWDGDLLIGVARSLTDFCRSCYLADLAVDRAYQKHGVGKRLVEQVRGAIGADTILLLLAAPAAMDYYPKIGFDLIENGYVIKPAWLQTLERERALASHEEARN
jgi:N-acetylglutamate synthase-like GNAT family acetyltransferase